MAWRFSRSHDQTSVECPRKGYLNYYAYGRGIVPKGMNLDQATGTLCHSILAAVMKIMQQGRIVEEAEFRFIADNAVAVYREEVRQKGFADLAEAVEYEIERQASLATALCWAWVRMRAPLIMEEYEILDVEAERVIPLPNDLELLSRLDAVCRRRVDGEYFAGPEFKTTGWVGGDFIEGWRYDTQTASHIIDVQHAYNVTPGGVMMEFLYKGARRKGNEGGYTYFSPLVRGFKHVDDITGEIELSADAGMSRRKGWTAFDTWTLPEGVVGWVNGLPEEVLREHLFATTIYRNLEEVAEWLRQVVYRQGFIRTGLQEIYKEGRTQEAQAEVEMAVVGMQFPGRMDKQCFSNMYRRKCPYLGICFGSVTDPLGSGLFEERTPHHENEFEA